MQDIPVNESHFPIRKKRTPQCSCHTDRGFKKSSKKPTPPAHREGCYGNPTYAFGGQGFTGGYLVCWQDIGNDRTASTIAASNSNPGPAAVDVKVDFHSQLALAD